MTLREYVRRARAVVAAVDALQANTRREVAEHRAAHGCHWWNGCTIGESAEYGRLNATAHDALMALPPGTRSVAAVDLFAAVDGLAARFRRPGRRPEIG